MENRSSETQLAADQCGMNGAITMSLRLNTKVTAQKTARGKLKEYRASYESLYTYPSRPTKEEATKDLASLIEFRCQSESKRVEVLPIRGHVGIFSYEMDGFVVTQHLWPEDQHISVSTGDKSIQDAKDSFRYHVAQHTWDSTSDTSEILQTDEARRKFRFWTQFQKAYCHATKVLGMEAGEAHFWAGDQRNFGSVPTIVA
jgi:hypothetical protein